MIVDPSSDCERILRIRDGEGIDTVCLTHWHEDHFKYIDLLDDCRLWTSGPDAEPLADMDIFLDWYGIAGDEGKELRKVIRPRLINEFGFKPRTPDRLLRDREIVDLGNEAMEVIATPGHSPGHLALFFLESRVLFLGDYNLDTFGPWYGDPYASIEPIENSLRRLREVPAKVWITSHGRDVIEEDPGEKWDIYLNAIQRREDDLVRFLKSPRTMDEIIDQWIILGKPQEPLNYYRFGEKAHLEKHLDRLMTNKQVHFENKKYRSMKP